MQSNAGTASKNILNTAQLTRVAGVLMGSFVLTALLGFVRQSVIGSTFGAGSELDAYFAGNRVSETLFTLISGGALGSAFIPVFSRFLAVDDHEGAWRLSSAVLTWVSLVAGLGSVLAAIFAQPIVTGFLSRDADAAQQALTIELLRIMLVTVLIFSVSGLCMAILNSHQRFFAASLTAGMYNIGLIIGALLLSPFMGIYGLAWGAVLGAVLHLAVQIPTLRQVKFQFAPRLALRTPGLAEVLRLMLPRVIGLAAFQLNFWVNTALTSGMERGSLSVITLAFALLFTVLGVIGQSVGTAVFPTLSALHAQDDVDGFRTTLATVLRGVLFMSIPATVGIILLSVPFIDVVYGRGRWNALDTVSVSWALNLYVFGLAGFALQEILARAFYARRNTWIPVVIAVFGVVLNIVLSLILIRVVRGGMPGQGEFGGLSLANALTTLVESALLWLLMARAIHGIQDRSILLAAFRTLVASLIMGIVVFVVDRVLAGSSGVLRLGIGAVVGALTFEGAALVLGLQDARTIPNAFLRRLKR